MSIRFRRSPRRPRGERGAILVLTAISMVGLMGFTAVAVDLGQRNQQLAGAQHAIDAAVITAAQYLSTHDGDYAGASARVKEVIEQNLGIDSTAWAGCDDPNHLDVSAPNDTNCISFRRIPATATTQVKNDIRVRLPRFQMDTVFGSALGLDIIDLAAAAASNGNNCGSGTSQICTPGTTAAPTTTAAAVTTTTTLTQYCKGFNPIELAFYTWVWKQCSSIRGDVDVTYWQKYACNNEVLTFVHDGTKQTWTLDGRYRYVWYWSVCSAYVKKGVREKWFGTICYAADLSLVWSDWSVWYECKQRRPSLEDWDKYWATTTTQPVATTAPTTTAVAPTSVPNSIDLSS